MKNRFLHYLLSGLAIAAVVSCGKDPVPMDDSDQYPNCYYFQAEIEGFQKKHIETRNAYTSVQTGSCFDEVTPDTTIHYMTFKAGFYQDAEDFTTSCREQLYVQFKNMHLDIVEMNMDPDSLFHNKFSTGDRNYFQLTNNVDSIASEGIEIIWVDKLGKTWSTKWETQEGSTFSITEDRQFIGALGEKKHEIKATFNCTLYDDEKTSLMCEEGIIFVDFQKTCN
ncbi:MAG: hypothetical protein KKD31_09730 [Bacteroidetes bacterium]|nr:hypothetical protein [Bacteroidota bacterium]